MHGQTNASGSSSPWTSTDCVPTHRHTRLERLAHSPTAHTHTATAMYGGRPGTKAPALSSEYSTGSPSRIPSAAGRSKYTNAHEHTPTAPCAGPKHRLQLRQRLWHRHRYRYIAVQASHSGGAGSGTEHTTRPHLLLRTMNPCSPERGTTTCSPSRPCSSYGCARASTPPQAYQPKARWSDHALADHKPSLSAIATRLSVPRGL